MKVFRTNITYKWLQDNLTIILLLPALLGGIWQLMELGTMGMAYIRFFSVSQLIADGILILFLLLLIIALTYSWVKG